MEDKKEKSKEEIQKEKLEIKLKQLESKLKQLEITEKTNTLNKWKECDIKRSNDEVLIKKLDTLKYMMSEFLIDEDSTQIGSEMKFKNAFDDDELAVIKHKIFDLIHKL